MTERELTVPVNLALPDGKRLNPGAKGWSRTPLHRANLRGVWGRTKRWDYWAVLAGDLVFSCVYADVDYIGLADVWWVDLASGQHGGKGIVSPFARGLDLPERPGTTPLHVRRKGFELTISDDPDTGATRIQGAWREPSGVPGEVDLTIALPVAHESLNVVIPWSTSRYQYTSKHQARPTTGTLRVGSRTWEITDDAWGVLDVGRGRWPFSTVWNWGGGAGRAISGEVIGLQIGGKWTEGTGHTENGVIVDGVLTKVHDELEWSYDWDVPLAPWRVADPGGHLELVLQPRYDKYSKIDLKLMGTETHQVFGTWSGTVTTDAGTLLFDDLQGFAEESRSRW